MTYLTKSTKLVQAIPFDGNVETILNFVKEVTGSDIDEECKKRLLMLYLLYWRIVPLMNGIFVIYQKWESFIQLLIPSLNISFTIQF